MTVWLPTCRRNVTLRLPDEQLRRLAGTCFRGRDLSAAGNFCRWESGGALLNDIRFERPLVAEIDKLVAETSKRVASTTHAVTIEYPDYVGWASTMARETVGPNQCDRFKPNRFSTALRVRADIAAIRAPRTKLVSMNIELRCDSSGWLAIIHTVYPGVHIGYSRPAPGEPAPVDLTETRGIVFLDWSVPGELLSRP